MPPTRRKLLASTAAALALAGCVGDGGSVDTTTETTSETTTTTTTTTATETTDATTETTTETTEGGEATATATVRVRSHPEHGDVLVDSEGLTLYMFDSDARGSGESTCSGGCANAWPPLTVEGDAAAGDAVAAELTTFQRSDGSTQVAANGWPLYYFASDDAPGDANGQGVNDAWWVLGPDGTPKRPAQTTTTTTTGSSATVQVRSHPEYGDVLVGPEEKTLYMFDRDTQGSGSSACSGGCAGVWPPLTVESDPTAGDAVTAELTTFQRSDGNSQVAANGWPLYYFASDDAPGDARGQGSDEVWWVLDPDGTPKRSENGTPTVTTEDGDDGDDDDDGDGNGGGGNGDDYY